MMLSSKPQGSSTPSSSYKHPLHQWCGWNGASLHSHVSLMGHWGQFIVQQELCPPLAQPVQSQDHFPSSLRYYKHSAAKSPQPPKDKSSPRWGLGAQQPWTQMYQGTSELLECFALSAASPSSQFGPLPHQWFCAPKDRYVTKIWASELYLFDPS